MGRRRGGGEGRVDIPIRGLRGLRGFDDSWGWDTGEVGIGT